ncbi:hypothetical protein D1864_03695 [Oceanobacillus picturae]|nr:hypothetical protein D1864_03695 [Oceanobacillus picturae]
MKKAGTPFREVPVFWLGCVVGAFQSTKMDRESTKMMCESTKKEEQSTNMMCESTRPIISFY